MIYIKKIIALIVLLILINGCANPEKKALATIQKSAKDNNILTKKEMAKMYENINAIYVGNTLTNIDEIAFKEKTKSYNKAIELLDTNIKHIKSSKKVFKVSNKTLKDFKGKSEFLSELKKVSNEAIEPTQTLIDSFEALKSYYDKSLLLHIEITDKIARKNELIKKADYTNGRDYLFNDKVMQEEYRQLVWDLNEQLIVANDSLVELTTLESNINLAFPVFYAQYAPFVDNVLK